MDFIIEKAKELGRLIQDDRRFYDYMLAGQAYEDDETLKNTIEEFQSKKTLLTAEVQKTEKDVELVKTLNEDVKSLYDQILSNERSIKLNQAQQEIKVMINAINQIVSGSASGLDPETIDISAGCSPNGCAGCSGC